MCGICGEICFAGGPADIESVLRMRDMLRHRGPDDEGSWSEEFSGGGVSLAHTRLAILDPTTAGHQPMSDPDERYWLVYNGEVYTYAELRAELAAQGYPFRSQTDSEVVLAAYAVYGRDCVSRFNGMYSFAVWDSVQQKLFCARDRLGIKPFYYSCSNSHFLFASEIKAILAHPLSKARPNHTSIYNYLSLGMMHHGSNTFFEDIHQLEPGCFLEFDRTGIQTQRYWTLPRSPVGAPDAFNAEELHSLLSDSVKLRLRSDVPLGVLLSGGLDSSSITALATHGVSSPLHVFSLDFGDRTSDESAYARDVAAHCAADIHFLHPKGAGLWEEMHALIRAQDAPTHAPEVYSSWCMMRAVADCGVKVLLCGEGGDELLGGYNWYPKYFFASLLRHGRLGTLIRELRMMSRNFPNPNTTGWFPLAALLVHALSPVFLKQVLKPELRGIKEILKPDTYAALQKNNGPNIKQLDPASLEEKMYNDMTLCTLPQYLRYEDANSMAFGIEERVPFLDHRLVEWANRLSVTVRMRNGWSKYALRKAMNAHLPQSVVWRRDKMGLSAPHDAWFRLELRRDIERMFHSECVIYDTWIEREVFRKQLDRYMNGERSTIRRLLWRVINLEQWLRIYTAA